MQGQDQGRVAVHKGGCRDGRSSGRFGADRLELGKMRVESKGEERQV